MYAFVTTESAHYSVRKLCHTLGLSRSAYYASKQRPKSDRQRMNKALLTHIQIAFHAHQKRYGSPRITQELKSHGVLCSENRVARLMQRAQLQAKMKKAFVRTTDSSHSLPLVSDLGSRSSLPRGRMNSGYLILPISVAWRDGCI